jgi:hypothetical protein
MTMARFFAILFQALGRDARGLLLALAACAAISAAAQVAGPRTAITVPGLGNGFDYYQGSYSLGWTFTPNSPITVTALGFYDDLQNGLTQSHPVGIYDKATQALLATATVVPTDPLTGFFHYTPLATPLTLAAGNAYVLMALVSTERYLAFAAIDPLWTVDPAITYGGSAVNYANPSATTLLYPDTFSAVGGDFGPNFLFTAAAAGPAVSLAPTSLAFSPQTVGTTSASQVVTLSNAGTAPLVISGIATTGDFATSSTCGPALIPGQNCQLTVTFTPLLAGVRTGTITITDDAPGTPHIVGLLGTGTSSVLPSISVSPTVTIPPTQVGTVSTSIDVVVLNTGASPLLISVAQIVGTDFFIVSDGCTGVPVAPDSTCVIAVTIAPSASGPILATLRLISNATNSPTLVTLSATGTPAPAGSLSAAPASLTFTEQVTGSASAPQLITVTNSGTVPASVSRVDVTGDFSQTSNCTRIDVGGTCSVSVVFHPADVGLRTGTLAILSDASNPVLGVSLSGRGALVPAPVIRLSVTSIAFGNRLMGAASSAQPVTLSNVGGADLAISAFGIRGDFSQANNCPAIVTPGASCRIDVGFLPSIPGERTGSLDVRSNAVSGNASVGLSGHGCRMFSVPGIRLATLLCQ